MQPRDVAGRTRRQLAVDFIDDVAVFDRKAKDIDKRLAEAVAAIDTTLTGTVGIGPVTAAAILGEVGRHPPLRQPAPLRDLHRHRPDRDQQR